MSDIPNRIADAEAARSAMDRWLGPAFDIVRADYLKKLVEVASKPMTADARAGMEKMAIAIKVVDAVQAQIMAVVNDGGVARNEHQYAEQIARIPVEKRKILGMSV